MNMDAKTVSEQMPRAVLIPSSLVARPGLITRDVERRKALGVAL